MHEFSQIEVAEAIARRAHQGQLRRDGSLYITHPEAVASMVEGRAKIVAWLHDVLEDSETTADDLRKAGLEEDIVEAVVAITKQKEEKYAVYLKRVVQNPLAAQVKKADIRHNLATRPTAQSKAKYLHALRLLANV